MGFAPDEHADMLSRCGEPDLGELVKPQLASTYTKGRDG